MTLFVYESICAGALGPDPPTSLLAEGRAMLHAIASDFARIADVVTLSRHSIPLVRCIPATSSDERRLFEHFVNESDAVLVIAPEFDDILAQRSELASHRRLLGSQAPAIRLASDKLALADHWTHRGVPTPPTRLATAMPTDFPVVIKPRDGAGSQGVRLVRGPEDWSTPSANTLMQEYVPGRPCSVAFLVGPGVTLPLRSGEQSLTTDLQYRGGRLPLDADEERRAIAIAAAAIDGIDGLAGFVGVDLVLGDRDVAIEINPRLTTSYIGLRSLCRDNLAAAWLDVLEGRSPALSWRDGQVTFLADGHVAR